MRGVDGISCSLMTFLVTDMLVVHPTVTSTTSEPMSAWGWPSDHEWQGALPGSSCRVGGEGRVTPLEV